MELRAAQTLCRPICVLYVYLLKPSILSHFLVLLLLQSLKLLRQRIVGSLIVFTVLVQRPEGIWEFTSSQGNGSWFVSQLSVARTKFLRSLTKRDERLPLLLWLHYYLNFRSLWVYQRGLWVFFS